MSIMTSHLHWRGCRLGHVVDRLVVLFVLLAILLLLFLEVLVFIHILPGVYLHPRTRQRLRIPSQFAILGLQLCYATLQIPHILDPCLQYSKLVHLHALTGRNHILQNTEFFIHFTPSPPLDDAMCSFAGDLAPGGACCGGLLAF